ncbi:unnamed protein product [Callosobruchus maculatus]|uniref:NADH dehydrogenase [ubiquinone] 1 alpha subcomplex subunit 11 n=1 Tax=Callosobruchus maculatus TaxID=64391 RepID=A0A653CW69_CALMS|nr:unnamed protein product [Callosobruchus maculatus]
MAQLRPYRYFDTPDGQDTFKKLWAVMKPAIPTTFFIGTADVLLHSHPKGYMETLGRYGYIAFPIIGASTVFVCTTNIAASVRNKDDKINWFLGGFAAGAMMGVWRKRAMTGWNMGMLFGFLAVMRKHAQENGWNITPPDDTPIATRGIWEVDWTLTAERPRNWTTGKAC